MNLAADSSTAIGLVAFSIAAMVERGDRDAAGWRFHSRTPDRGERGAALVMGQAGRGATGFAARVADHRPARRGGRLRPIIGSRRDGARWADVKDILPLIVGHRRTATPPPAGRLPLGTAHRRRIAAERGQSVIVFGPTQSGKTTSVAVPAILGWEGPVVATSVKTDLVSDTETCRAAWGEVAVFDPTGVTGRPSAGWSPLAAASTWPAARRVAASLSEGAKGSIGAMSDGDFWYATASKMLAPLLFAAATGGLAMSDVVRWVDTMEEREVFLLLDAAGVAEATDSARSLFGKEDRQRSSIYTTVETILEPFAGGMATCSGRGANWEEPGCRGPSPNIDPGRLVSGANTLYLCAPAHDQRRLSPLFTAVVHQIVEHVYDRVTRTGRPLDPPLLMVLDEAANIAPLSDLDALASTSAGHGIQLVTIWHDLAQITARYGPRAATVVNNHRAKLFLSGISDPSTLEHASSLIGNEEVLLPAVTSGGPSGSSTTRSPSTRPLVAPDALRRVGTGRGVLVYGGLPPVALTLCPWFDDVVLATRGGPGSVG